MASCPCVSCISVRHLVDRRWHMSCQLDSFPGQQHVCSCPVSKQCSALSVPALSLTYYAFWWRILSAASLTCHNLAGRFCLLRALAKSRSVQCETWEECYCGFWAFSKARSFAHLLNTPKRNIFLAPLGMCSQSLFCFADRIPGLEHCVRCCNLGENNDSLGRLQHMVFAPVKSCELFASKVCELLTFRLLAIWEVSHRQCRKYQEDQARHQLAAEPQHVHLAKPFAETQQAPEHACLILLGWTRDLTRDSCFTARTAARHASIQSLLPRSERVYTDYERTEHVTACIRSNCVVNADRAV